MRGVSVPGVAWSALIIVLTGAISGWLTQWVQEPWVPLVVLALTALAKLVEVLLGKSTSRAVGAPAVSRTARFFLGG